MQAVPPLIERQAGEAPGIVQLPVSVVTPEERRVRADPVQLSQGEGSVVQLGDQQLAVERDIHVSKMFLNGIRLVEEEKPSELTDTLLVCKGLQIKH